jgi:hypothetical protein
MENMFVFSVGASPVSGINVQTISGSWFIILNSKSISFHFANDENSGHILL